MGIATFQTYNRCRSGRPSLEIAWGLHPVNIPEASLSLSLVPESDVQSASESKKSGNGSTWLQLESTAKEKQLIKCCGECCDDELETEAGRSFRSSTCTSEATTSTLPSWLQQYKDQTTKHGNENDQDCVPVKDLCRRWNSFSSSSHKQPYSNERTITFSSLSPSSSTTAFSYDHQNPSSHQTRREWPLFEPKQYWSDHHFSTSERSPRMYIPERKEPKQATLCSNPNSTSSSDVVMESEINLQRFREWNSENLKTLCAALEKRVPWQKDIIPEIASTVLQCRSGMVRRKGKATGGSKAKEETWLFFQGVDADAKEEIARELARLVFGSNDLVSISLSSFSSTRADSTEVDLTNKRSRDEQSCSYIERFAEAVARNPRRVFLVEDVEQADYCSQVGMRRAIERGRIGSSDGNEVSLCDAIVILSCESFSSRSRAPSPPVKQNSDGSGEEIKTSPCTVSLDLNISFDEDGGDCNGSINDVGLLESVDRRVFFKIQEL